MRVLLGTAQPGLWRSLLSAATDLSFASVLPLATDRTRSRTTFGNIGSATPLLLLVATLLGCYIYPSHLL